MTSAIVSVSGIRGIFGQTIDPSYVAAIASKFGSFLNGGKVALGSDTRRSAESLRRGVCSGLLSSGCTVYDMGYTSTPSVFKEVQARRLSGGVMVTASHNPPEWNGLKFVLEGGRGVFENEFASILDQPHSQIFHSGRLIHQPSIYYEILRNKAGKGTASGVKVALDLAGGVGSLFIPSLLAYQKCEVHTIHDTPGVFPRIIDPTVDPLTALSEIVTARECNVGFAFDCDADRLVIMDERGKKLSGDATLVICLQHFLENSRNRTVAVSVDTSLAAEDLIREYNGKIVYSKVGEANVVRKIIENGCGAGGEGSSGGYIEPGFVMCRDGVYASTMIVKIIQSEGSLGKLISRLEKYSQDRAKLDIDREVAKKVLEVLVTTESGIDATDGLKLRLSEKAWILIRPSNTENVLRISAEAKSQERATQLVEEYTRRIRGIESSILHR